MKGYIYTQAGECVLTCTDEKHMVFSLQDFAHELESIVSYAWIYENGRWFYHFNFTTKTETAFGILFFAEVSRIEQEHAWEVKHCCMIGSNDNGILSLCSYCYLNLVYVVIVGDMTTIIPNFVGCNE